MPQLRPTCLGSGLDKDHPDAPTRPVDDRQWSDDALEPCGDLGRPATSGPITGILDAPHRSA
jgi:hypothetical protein